MDLSSKAEGYDKKQKAQINALISLANNVVEWCTLYKNTFNEIENLKLVLSNLKGSISESATFGKFKFVVKVTNSLNITNLLSFYNDSYLKSSSRGSSFLNILEKSINGHFEYLTSKKLLSLITEYVDSSYKVEYLIYDGNELINNMSEGRKVSVYLNILLNKDDKIEPLIIDQPEDDMDNKDIFSILVETLRNRKFARQIILATHDANVVVNGDAENVIIASRNNKRTKISYNYGSLEYKDDSTSCRKTICEILEGGEKAFIKRAFKYDLDKTKIYKWED